MPTSCGLPRCIDCGGPKENLRMYRCDACTSRWLEKGQDTKGSVVTRALASILKWFT